MRVVITGATGNVGTSVVRAVRDDKSVDHVIGLVRRPPAGDQMGVEWRSVDLARDALDDHLRGADAVVHLAWAMQPTRDAARLHQVNVAGSARLFEAVADAKVGALLYSSSSASYSPVPTKRAVDEDWPTGGIPTSVFSRQKANVERLLDDFEMRHHFVRVVRLRPGLVLKAEAASEIQRLFVGAFMSKVLSRVARLRTVPDVAGAAIQVVHTDDLADAFRRALLGSVAGAFNIACEEAITGEGIADHFRLRRLRLNQRVARGALHLTWRTHVQPTDPGWLDVAVGSPLLDTSRAQEELDWRPSHPPFALLQELAEAMVAGSGIETAPLRPGPGLRRPRRSSAGAPV